MNNFVSKSGHLSNRNNWIIGRFFFIFSKKFCCIWWFFIFESSHYCVAELRRIIKYRAKIWGKWRKSCNFCRFWNQKCWMFFFSFRFLNTIFLNLILILNHIMHDIQIKSSYTFYHNWFFLTKKTYILYSFFQIFNNRMRVTEPASRIRWQSPTQMLFNN